MLAAMHFKGEGGPHDMEEARRLFRLAAAKGCVYAQASLACMLLKGEGGLQSTKEARRYYELAAAQGHETAQAVLKAMDKEQRAMADEVAAQLLAEEELEKDAKANPTPGKKKKKNDKQSRRRRAAALPHRGSFTPLPRSRLAPSRLSRLHWTRQASCITCLK